MTAEKVLSEICRRSWRLGVAVVVAPESNVDCEGEKVGGYFDPDKRVICVSGGRAEHEWLGILLHEYSHACQWYEGTACWSAAENTNGMWDWLAGKKVRNVLPMIVATRELEADCERRTYRLIRELDAPIDAGDYCRSANAYVHFYNTMATERKWYAPNRGPYEAAELRALFNPTIDRDFSKTPAKMAAALRTCL